MNDRIEELKGFITDAIEAIQGLRPEDAIIALNNAEATLEELEEDQ